MRFILISIHCEIDKKKCLVFKKQTRIKNVLEAKHTEPNRNEKILRFSCFFFFRFSVWINRNCCCLVHDWNRSFSSHTNNQETNDWVPVFNTKLLPFRYRFQIKPIKPRSLILQFNYLFFFHSINLNTKYETKKNAQFSLSISATATEEQNPDADW